jgi:predicted DNA-binding transcriptional regulator AlpA
MGAKSKFLSSADVAKCCDVEVKTIHNWVADGRFPHYFRSPGRQLRFTYASVVAFLNKYGYPVPTEVAAGAADETAPGGSVPPVAVGA